MRQWRRLGSSRKLVIGILTGAALSALLTVQLLPDKVSLRVNQIAPEDVVAHRYVQYMDARATQQLRAEAEANVPKQYANDHGAPAEAEREVRRFFATVRRVQASAPLTRREHQLHELAKALGSLFPQPLLDGALALDRETLRRPEQQTTS